MQKIKTIDPKNFNIDFSKIATTSANVKSGSFINEGSIYKSAFDNLEELSFDEFDNGTVLIKSGGSALGWTTKDGIKLDKVDSNVKVEVDKPVAKEQEVLAPSKLEITPRRSLDGMNPDLISWANTVTGVPMPNCYTYARARISEALNRRTKISDIPIGQAGNLWEIHNGDFVQSDKPQPGALMIWKNAYDPANGFGHVAVCEAVNVDGTIDWTQSNYGGPMFEYISGNPSGQYGGLTFMGYLIPKELQ